ncbi:uncharacterized protein LOC132872297 [Neoarius graeffei]|uniref:uncharacterized protein LOC132872297 n=1 Tax=Neoarius graeffei TaxID=443677 RepID=UPI00298CAE75|nr:uncharacterized protein LOC132872297 [Neoarius graeffei]
MKCLYLLSVVFHVAAGTGCAFSGDNNLREITRHRGGSVLLPCSCSDLNTKPQKFTWETSRKGHLTEVLNDEHYHGRFQLFNNISPANLSLLLSDLREEDQGVYKCSTEREHRDIRLYVQVGRRETSTHSSKTDTTPPSEQHQSKTTNSPPTASSTTLKQVFGILAVLLFVIPGVVTFICWRRRGGRCGENRITEERPDCKRKQMDQTGSDVTYSTVTHINTAGAARVQINAEEKTEYTSIITN